VGVWEVETSQEVFRLKGHFWPVRCVAFSPDGQRLVSSSEDGIIKVWDLATGREERTLPGHANPTHCLAFSPDGKRLASASTDPTVKLWDVRSGLEVLTFRGHNTSVWGVAFSPDGRLATAGIPRNGVVRIWAGRPWTPEAAIEREVLGILQALFGKPLAKADVVAYLRNAKTLRPEAVQKALALADRYDEEIDPEKYYQASWATGRKPYLNAIQYGFALQQAQAACQLTPDQANYRSTFGMAQYRVGRYQEALATLTQAEPTAAGSPSVLAFLAMAQHQLGQTEKAQTTLEQLRQMMMKPEWVRNAEAHSFLREAEALVRGAHRN
jgi:hypothetical protein